MKNLLLAIEAVLYLTGASCIEELDEDLLSRFERLETFPVKVNYCTKEYLVESGLVSIYQAASLIEYRDRTGGILSITELGLIDGYCPALAEALSPFISLDMVQSDSPGRQGHRRRTLTVSGADKVKECGRWSGSALFSYEDGQCGANVGVKYSDNIDGSVSAIFRGVGILRKFVLGDYNLRYGQGAALWNGFQLGGLPTVEAVCRKPTGISPGSSRSRGDKHRGAALGLALGNFTTDLFYSYGELIGADIGFTGRSISVDMLCFNESGMTTASLSGRGSLNGIDLFAEAAFRPADRALNAVVGTLWNIGYRISVAARASVSGKKMQASFGARYKEHSITADWNGRYLKCIYNGSLSILPDDARARAALKARAVAKYQENWKYDLRIDACTGISGFELNGRYDIVFGKSTAWLWYLEAGYRENGLQLYIRGGLFKIDEWDDRIYVYERDAPSSFNVPAYYGRGWNASAVLAWKGLHVRAGITRYPGSEKVPTSELKLQYKFEW